VLTDRQGPLYAEPMSEWRPVSEHARWLLLPMQWGWLVVAWQELHRARRRQCRRGHQVYGRDHDGHAGNRENHDYHDHDGRTDDGDNDYSGQY